MATLVKRLDQGACYRFDDTARDPEMPNIEPSRTAVLVVDMQNDYVTAGAKLRLTQAVRNVPKLASTLKIRRGRANRVIHTEQVDRRDGSDVDLFDDLYLPIEDGSSFIDNALGADAYPDPTLVPCAVRASA
ncbi:isochorismatase family protein [Bradyrhizobium betae]|uniref:isochorismatase family protein n=1 Tax=Bradyrhizobium betae TaxID=244734 RepID=UPI0013E90163|nr:isochorismatase family protein [Bradyrhizobium betae]